MSTTTHHFEIEFQGYWHAGTGEAGPGDLDAVVLRDADGIPCFPGKALKGLFHEAFCEMIAESNSGAPSKPHLLALFGSPGNESVRRQAQLRFSNASLPAPEQTAIVTAGFQDALTHAIASTALEDGIAVNRSLRRIEVAIPMTLGFEVAFHGNASDFPAPKEVGKWLGQAAGRIRMAGAHRHNGLGECRVRLVSTQESGQPDDGSTNIPAATHQEENLVRIPFSIETLEPVVLGENAATTGAHDALDFITGAALLGAFARDHYRDIAKLGSDSAFRVFHAGDVRFGDAQPVSSSGYATFLVPASWHFEKGAALFEGESGNPMRLSTDKLKDLGQMKRDEGTDLKQARGQWMAGDASELNVRQRQHLKSARNSAEFGRPAPSQLFSYQSIEKGQRFAGEIHIRHGDDGVPQAAIDLIAKWVAAGPRVTLGRSRAAEFGLCKLSPLQAPLPLPPSKPETDRILLYALTDICPPGLELLPALGEDWNKSLENLKIDLEHTHIRVREYARWNGFRGCPDPAVRVICRGSVIAFKPGNVSIPDIAAIQKQLDLDGVGLELQHGLGRVLVNPDFSALANQELAPILPQCPTASPRGLDAPSNTPLLALAKLRHSRIALETKTDSLAGELQRKWEKFSPLPSPSQWSRLRHLAANSNDFGQFLNRAKSVFDHGASRRIWEHSTSDSKTLLAQILINLSNLQKKTKPGVSDHERQDPSRKDPEVSPFLRELAGKQTESDGERLVLLAIAEACRRLRQQKNKKRV
jgi:hypothetical protein